MTDEEISRIVESTVLSVTRGSSPVVQIKKPTTMQGWVYVILGVGSILAFMWTSVVFLNRLSHHPDLPHHAGTEKAIAELKAGQRTDAELKLSILEETAPIRAKIDVLRDDVSRIQTNVDILVEDSRARRREGQ